VTAALLEVFGWRSTVLILASVSAAVTIPVRLLLPGRGARAQETSLGPIGGVPSFARLLNGGFALQAFAATGGTVCLVWQLVERGETLGMAAAVAGLAGASQVPGRLLLSPLRSVVPTDVRLPLLLVVQGVALVGIASLSGPALALAVITFGAAAGVMTLERAAVVVEWLGRENFGTGSGQLASGALLARAGAPFAVELLHRSISYAATFGVLAFVVLLGAAVVAVAARARRRSSVLHEGAQIRVGDPLASQRLPELDDRVSTLPRSS
jgi:hypothetical protein